jgi:hypothetical protein
MSVDQEMLKSLSNERIDRDIQALIELRRFYKKGERYFSCPLCYSCEGGTRATCILKKCIWVIMTGETCFDVAFIKYRIPEFVEKRIPEIGRWIKVLRNELKRRTQR